MFDVDRHEARMRRMAMALIGAVWKDESSKDGEVAKDSAGEMASIEVAMTEAAASAFGFVVHQAATLISDPETREAWVRRTMTGFAEGVATFTEVHTGEVLAMLAKRDKEKAA